MATLIEEIEAQITGGKAATAKQYVGNLVEIGDGVARVDGLTRAKLNEMLDFGQGIVGLALNLDETEVRAIILGDYTLLNEGDEVRTTGKLLQVPVGKGLLGRVVNMLIASSMPSIGKSMRAPSDRPIQLRCMSLMGSGQCGKGQFEHAERIAIGNLFRAGLSKPIAPTHHQRSALRGGGSRYFGSSASGIVLRHQRHPGAGDARLLEGDACERIGGGALFRAKQERLVINPQRGYPAGEPSLQNVGRIEPSAKPNLDHADIGRHPREGEEHGGGGDFEEARREVCRQIENLFEQRGEQFVAY